MVSTPTTQPGGQPQTILVKKKDGSFVRVPRDTFMKEKKEGTKKAESTVEAPKKPTVRLPTRPAAPVADPSWNKNDAKSLLDDEIHNALPMKADVSYAVSTSAPVTKIFVDEAIAAQRLTADSRPPASASSTSEWRAGQPSANNNAKPTVRDIHPPVRRRTSMGPVDEIGSFTLEEFRRLHSAATQAEAMVLDKFMILQKESYLIFMEAVRVWRESPLYQTYMTVIERALTERKSIDAILAETAGSGGLKKDEFLSLIYINRQAS